MFIVYSELTVSVYVILKYFQSHVMSNFIEYLVLINETHVTILVNILTALH